MNKRQKAQAAADEARAKKSDKSMEAFVERFIAEGPSVKPRCAFCGDEFEDLSANLSSATCSLAHGRALIAQRKAASHSGLPQGSLPVGWSQ